MAQVFKLYRIQQVDTKIDSINKRLIEIEDEIINNKSVLTAEANLEKIKNAQLSKQKDLTKLEDEITKFRIKLDQNQSSLYGGKITNPKELQDLQIESDALHRKITDLEDKLIGLMIEAEEINDEVTDYQAALNSEKNNYATKVSKLNAEKANNLSELNRLSGERETISSSIPPDELLLYIEIRNKRKGIAVTKVVEKSCSACGSSLSATLLRQAKSPSHIAFCETCGRILYAE